MLTIEFPVYRKYSNNRSYFRIDSKEGFVELKQEPVGYKKYEFEVKILPDRVFIEDLISLQNEFILESSEEEFEAIAEKINA